MKTKHRFYKKWSSIKERCYIKTHPQYKDYGGRGIVLSDEFKDADTFLKFLDELEGYGIDGRTMLDRIDNDGIYERGNLKWANRQEQQENRRVHKYDTSGFQGLTFNKKFKQWVASIYIKDKQIYIGMSKCPEDARQLRIEYLKLHNLPIKNKPSI